MINTSRFNEKMFNIFVETYSVYLKTVFEDNKIAKNLPELEKIVRSRISNIFNLRFREEDFISILLDGRKLFEFSKGLRFWNDISTSI